MTFPPLRPTDPQPPTSAHSAPTQRPDSDVVIRPAAVIQEDNARAVLTYLETCALESGGVWSVGASTGIWQRYDRPWTGAYGGRGESQLVGTIYVTYDKPRKFDVLIHRVHITDHGLMLGWTTTHLVDEILSQVGLSLESCPRETSLPTSYRSDPFRRDDAYSRGLGA